MNCTAYVLAHHPLRPTAGGQVRALCSALALCLGAFAPVLALGCGGGNTASQLLKAQDVPVGEGQAKCKIAKSQAEPLIVEWPETARAKLESLRKRGLVAVRYSGCELEVISQCRVKGDYGYSGVTAKQTSRKIRDADELYANLPLGAVKLEGTLQSAGQLNVDMTLVGRYEAPAMRFDRTAMDGDCEGATHVVAALAVGAFTFYAGADAKVGGGVSSTMGAGAGGKSSAARETLTRDGDDKACAGASSRDQAPPEGCGALLQLEVVPIAAGNAMGSVTGTTTRPDPRVDTVDRTCPAGQVWSDGRCRPAKTSALDPKSCAAGTHREGSRCVPDDEPQPEPTRTTQVTRPPTCAPGTHREGSRCVSDAPKEESNGAPVALWYLSGALVLGSGILGGAAYGISQDAKKACNEASKTCPQDSFDKQSRALTFGWISTGMLIAGGASIALAILWPTLFAPAKGKAAVSLLPQVSRDGAALGAGGTF